MRTNSVNFNNRISAAKINIAYTPKEDETTTSPSKDLKEVLKPLEVDTLTFGKKDKEKKDSKSGEKIPAFMHSMLLNMGQKRAPKIEAQAKLIEEDAAEAMGFSYVGSIMSHSRETITDGIETNDDARTTSQIYEFKDGVLTKAEIGITESLKTGAKTTKQIYEFENGKLSAVYENVTEFKDGTKDFKRKYLADEKGHLKCVYNKVF